MWHGSTGDNQSPVLPEQGHKEANLPFDKVFPHNDKYLQLTRQKNCIFGAMKIGSVTPHLSCVHAPLKLTLEGLSEVLTGTVGIVYDTLQELQQMNSGSSIDYSENKNTITIT